MPSVSALRLREGSKNVLTAAQIVSLACQTAKVPGYTAQGGQFLNLALANLCQNYDLDAAKLALNLTMPNATRQIGNLNAALASGPVFLPPDYLRAKIGDVMWFNAGLPIYMTPIDLAQFDLLPQMAGLMSFPTFWATDVSQPQLQLETALVYNATTTLAGISDTSNLYAGAVIVSPNFVPQGTTIAAIVDANTVTMSKAALVSATGATAVFQQPPLAYVWPPVTGGVPVLVRYYSQVPDLSTPETSNQVPWFPDQQYLIDEVTGRLMKLSGDDRWEAMLSDNENAHPGGSGVRLRKYLIMKDDDTNRAKHVALDARRFGRNWGQLPASKVYGF